MASYEHSVLLALVTAGRPLTAKEIAQRTRIGLVSVYRICERSPNILELGGRPAQYYAKKYDELDTNSVVIEFQRPAEGWFEWVESAKQTFETLSNIGTKSRHERSVIATGLRALGILLISLSNDIMKGLDRPDWYKLLEQENNANISTRSNKRLR